MTSAVVGQDDTFPETVFTVRVYVFPGSRFSLNSIKVGSSRSLVICCLFRAIPKKTWYLSNSLQIECFQNNTTTTDLG